MLQSLINLCSSHASHAHWFILFGALLAGCNLPISIDALVIIAALLAAHFVPEHTYLLYFTLLIGCSISAWISYFLGKYIGPKLKKQRLFKSLLTDQKIKTIQTFYRKYGILTFIIGRFIPFGVRNCLFMTSGLSQMPFLRFVLLDFTACFLWITCTFTTFFYLGHNFEALWSLVQSLNLYIFFTFLVAVIALIWYKRSKKTSTLHKKNFDA